MTAQTKFLQQFNEAFAKGDINYISQQVTDDIEWNMVGDFSLKGKKAFDDSLQEMKGTETLDMQILNTIINGKFAAVDGTMKIKESSGNIKSFGFCDLYEFNNDGNKIRKMTSYIVPVEK
jgi:ketosteroid isomerase-like protein